MTVIRNFVGERPRPDRAVGPLPRIAMLALVAFLPGGCAGLFTPAHEYQSARAERVLAAGFENIHDKYIDALQPGDYAPRGIENLDLIDPELNVTVSKGHLRLTRGTSRISEIKTPPPGDAPAWGRLAAQSITAARQVSPLLLRASSEAIYKAVFDGALDSLDSHSRYAGLESAQDYRAQREGFGGLGVRLNFEQGAVEIVAIIPGTPAENSPLRAGDIITHVDNTPLAGLKRRDVIWRLRGKVGTIASVLVKRKGHAPLAVEIERALIVSPTVYLKRDGNLAIIRITGFNHHTARNLERIVKQLPDRIGGIVLDLRGNPGGLLDQAVAAANLFLPEGDIVSTRGRHPASFQFFRSTEREYVRGSPMVVLVNGQSASAAEIVAAALQDRGRALIVGTNSYGKGTVQNITRLPNGGEMILTWSRFHAPSGYLLDQLGTYPNICTSTMPKALSGDTAKIADHIRGKIAETAILLSAWRSHTRINDVRESKFRKRCPKRTEHNALDLETARQLLSRKTLFAQILAGTRPALARSKSRKSAP